MSTIAYAHVALDEANVPMLAGTQIKVVEIVLDHLANGLDAHEIQRQYPVLSLGQIHSALAYYYDHQAEMDRDIERRLQRVEQIKSRLGPGPISDKLTARELLP